MLRVGGVQLSVAEPVVVVDDTTIENAGSEAVRLPSLTLMPMFEYVPVCALLGVPDSLPVVVLNVAHAGLFADAERQRLALRVLRRRRERVGAAGRRRTSAACR